MAKFAKRQRFDIGQPTEESPNTFNHLIHIDLITTNLLRRLRLNDIIACLRVNKRFRNGIINVLENHSKLKKCLTFGKLPTSYPRKRELRKMFEDVEKIDGPEILVDVEDLECSLLGNRYLFWKLNGKHVICKVGLDNTYSPERKNSVLQKLGNSTEMGFGEFVTWPNFQSKTRELLEAIPVDFGTTLSVAENTQEERIALYSSNTKRLMVFDSSAEKTLLKVDLSVLINSNDLEVEKVVVKTDFVVIVAFERQETGQLVSSRVFIIGFGSNKNEDTDFHCTRIPEDEHGENGVKLGTLVNASEDFVVVTLNRESDLKAPIVFRRAIDGSWRAKGFNPQCYASLRGLEDNDVVPGNIEKIFGITADNLLIMECWMKKRKKTVVYVDLEGLFEKEKPSKDEFWTMQQDLGRPNATKIFPMMTFDIDKVGTRDEVCNVNVFQFPVATSLTAKEFFPYCELICGKTVLVGVATNAVVFRRTRRRLQGFEIMVCKSRLGLKRI